MTSNVEVCKAFFTATAAGDGDAIKSVCAAAFKGTQNGGPQMDLATLVGFALAVKKAIPDFRYDNAVRSRTDTGFVEEHDVLGTLPDGSLFSMPVVVVADVKDGQITSMREYFDSRAAAGLLKALS